MPTILQRLVIHMPMKYKNFIYPVAIGVVMAVLAVLVGCPLVQAAFPLPLLVVTGYNLYKGKSIGKLYLYGFIAAGVTLLVFLALAFMAKLSRITINKGTVGFPRAQSSPATPLISHYSFLILRGNNYAHTRYRIFLR